MSERSAPSRDRIVRRDRAGRFASAEPVSRARALDLDDSVELAKPSDTDREHRLVEQRSSMRSDARSVTDTR